jgi:hypothetical protein
MNIKNIGHRNTVRTLVVGAGVLAAVAVVGCGTQSAGSQNTSGSGSQTLGASAPSNPNTGTGSSTSDSSASTGATGNTPQAAGSPNAAGVSHPSEIGGVPECKANTLALSFGGSDAGMSQHYQVLRFTNTGKTTCAVVGWPGVSYVTGDNGQQLGAPAVRNGQKGAQVNLAPGAVASTVIHSVDTGVYDNGACQPTPVQGYRVYAPDDTASMFIALPSGTTACANPADTGLGVVTLRPGLGSTEQYQS